MSSIKKIHNGKRNDTSPMISINKDRELQIYTYSSKRHKECPFEVDRVYDMTDITIKDKLQDYDLSKLTGLDDDLRNHIMSIHKIQNYLKSIVKRIEKQDMNYIAICCTNGKHRSVSMAIELGKLYPNSNVKHVGIN